MQRNERLERRFWSENDRGVLPDEVVHGWNLKPAQAGVGTSNFLQDILYASRSSCPSDMSNQLAEELLPLLSQLYQINEECRTLSAQLPNLDVALDREKKAYAISVKEKLDQESLLRKVIALATAGGENLSSEIEEEESPLMLSQVYALNDLDLPSAFKVVMRSD